jgi:hypothetical protein
VKDSTGEDIREAVTVTSLHEEELPGSKGTANFALKWAKDRKHVAYLKVVEIEKPLKSKGNVKITGQYTAEDNGEYVGLVAFDCRGLDVVDWHPEVQLELTNSSSPAVIKDTNCRKLAPIMCS